MQLKRTFLLGVIGSLSLAALLGIWAFLFGSFGDTEFKIIMTTLTAALFSLTSLGASIVLERGRWRIAMISTFVISGLGLVLFLLTIWIELWRYVDDDWLFKAIVTIPVWAVAIPLMGLLALPSFKGVYLWIRRAVIVVALILAVSLTICVLVEGEPDEEFWLREIGVFGILTALGIITVPILAKVVSLEKKAGVESTPLDIKITCPRCLLEQTVHSGHSRCSACKLRFEIRIEEPRCPQCDYLLHKLSSPICPECGYYFGKEEVVEKADEPSAGDV